MTSNENSQNFDDLFGEPEGSPLITPEIAPEITPEITTETTSEPLKLETQEDHFSIKEPIFPQYSSDLETPGEMQSRLKTFSERTPIGTPQVAVAYPFSLKIDGELSLHDREKLLDFLSREKMDISEIDLEVQFQAGKILIPRISEYTGVAIVQLLMDAPVKMRLAPADKIYSTAETLTTNEDLMALLNLNPDLENSAKNSSTEQIQTHAPAIPVIAGEITESTSYEAIDSVSATAILKTTSTESTESPDYQRVIEALQLELKYKAHQKKASHVIHFQISVTRLTMPDSYRITALGTAIRLK